MDKKTSGFTLIEMLVGIVIGMIVVAAASVMMVTVLKSQKDITASARLNQELGAAMAVISNEIRRAGFSVCDVANSDCDSDSDGVEELSIKYNTSASNKDLEIFDVDGTDPPVKGDCILYRYNANVDENGSVLGTDFFSEHRGIRFIDDSDGIGVVQIADENDAIDIKCDVGVEDDVNDRWVTLTDPNVINIDITVSSFSTTGSKCRNMTLPDPNPDPEVIAQYWVVGNAATGLACDDNSDTVDYCIVTVNSSPPPENITSCTSVTKTIASGDKLFGTRQIVVTLEATLTRDQAVTKRLESSVKVANPRIEIVL